MNRTEGELEYFCKQVSIIVGFFVAWLAFPLLFIYFIGGWALKRVWNFIKEFIRAYKLIMIKVKEML